MFLKDRSYESANRFINQLNAYMDTYIDEIYEGQDFYTLFKGKIMKTLVKKGYYDFHIEFHKRIYKKNLLRYYKSDTPIEYDISLPADEYAEVLKNVCKNPPINIYKLDVEKADRFGIEERLDYFINNYIEKYRNLRMIFNGSSNNIFIDFNLLKQIMKTLKISLDDEIYVILFFIIKNLEKNITTREDCSFIKNDIITSYRILEGILNSNTLMENSAECIMPAIIKIADLSDKNVISQYLNTLNRDILKSIKNNTKQQTVVEEEKVIPKSNKKDNEIYQKLKEYYNINTKELTHTLSIDEIKYVVFLLREYGISEEGIIDFVRIALRQHKQKDPIDRYLELSKKIEFYSEEGNVSELNKVLSDMLEEYNNASEDEKDFWHSSFEVELLELEKVFNNKYSYELS